MSMSSIHVFDGGVIPDSESSGGSSGSANVKNLVMRDFVLNIGGETVPSKILCDYNSPQQSSPYYAPVSIEDMAQWTHDGFVMQVRLESQPSIAANLGFLARVSISHDSIEDEVTNAKVFTYERLDDHRIKFNILNFDKITDEVTSIDYLRLSGMDEFTLDSSIDTTIAEILDKIPSTASANNKLVTEQQLDDATASMASGYTPKGPASVSTLNGLTEKENGDQYIVTNSGTLTDGSLSVIAGESVAWDSVNEEWYKVNQYALKRFGTNEVKNLPTAITDFRTGDNIVVDGPSGPAKMTAETLLQATAQNALAGNVAPEFDETRTSENPYAVGELVVKDGVLYEFTIPHYGGWTANHAKRVTVESLVDKLRNSGNDVANVIGTVVPRKNDNTVTYSNYRSFVKSDDYGNLNVNILRDVSGYFIFTTYLGKVGDLRSAKIKCVADGLNFTSFCLSKEQDSGSSLYSIDLSSSFESAGGVYELTKDGSTVFNNSSDTDDVWALWSFQNPSEGDTVRFYTTMEYSELSGKFTFDSLFADPTDYVVSHKEFSDEKKFVRNVASGLVELFSTDRYYAIGDMVLYDDGNYYVFKTPHIGAWSSVDAKKIDTKFIGSNKVSSILNSNSLVLSKHLGMCIQKSSNKMDLEIDANYNMVLSVNSDMSGYATFSLYLGTAGEIRGKTNKICAHADNLNFSAFVLAKDPISFSNPITLDLKSNFDDIGSGHYFIEKNTSVLSSLSSDTPVYAGFSIFNRQAGSVGKFYITLNDALLSFSKYMDLNVVNVPPTVIKKYASHIYDKAVWTLGDSLFSNTWQPYLVELTGCKWSATKNADPLKPISKGGTQSAPADDDGGQARAINLVSYKGDEPIDYVIIENVNDRNVSSDSFGSISDTPFMRSVCRTVNIPDGANMASWIESNWSDVVGAIESSEKQKGYILKFVKNASGSSYRGSEIAFGGAVVNEGDISVVLNNITYGVHVTVGMTLSDVVDAFLDYDFGAGWTDVRTGDNSFKIIYYTETSARATVNVGSTGLTASSSDATGVNVLTYYYRLQSSSGFDSMTNWTLTKPSLYAVYKGLVEYLRNELPEATLVWFIPWAYGVNFSSDTYKNADGSWSQDKFTAGAIYTNSEVINDIQRAVARYYGIKCIDMFEGGQMCINNIETYFNTSNVHPKSAGYKLYAKFIASEI